MTTVPGAPTFDDPAENGQIKFYGLHEKKGEFEAIQNEMAAKFLPENVKKTYRPWIAHKMIDHLCNLGMFVSNPSSVVIAIAFVHEAVAAFKLVYPEHALPYPECMPYWDAQNAMVSDLCDSLAPKLGSDAMAVNHKVYFTVLYVLNKLQL